MTIASADVDNPGGAIANQQYIFTVTIDALDGGGNDPPVRTLELLDSAGVDDPNVHPVSTNQAFFAAANLPHTFRFLGRKVGAAINTNVLRSTLSVVCIGG